MACADLAQAIIEGDFHAIGFCQRLGGFAGADHGAGVEAIDLRDFFGQPCRQCCGLPLAQIGEAGIIVTALWRSPVIEINEALGVTDEVEVHRWWPYWIVTVTGGESISQSPPLAQSALAE